MVTVTVTITPYDHIYPTLPTSGSTTIDVFDLLSSQVDSDMLVRSSSITTLVGTHLFTEPTGDKMQIDDG